MSNRVALEADNQADGWTLKRSADKVNRLLELLLIPDVDTDVVSD